MILAVILGSYLMIGVDMSIVNIALPSLSDGLHFSTVGLSWVINAYMLAYGGLLILGGRSGDIVGRKRTLLTGVTLFTLASVLGGFATTAWWLIASRILQGIGAALAAPSTLSLLAVSFPEGPRRNRALSIYSSFASLGMIIGMVLGGVLTGWLSWRWVFFVNVPVGLALVIGIPRVLKETERQPGRFDLLGALTSTTGMTLLVYSLIRTASVGWHDPPTVGALTGAILLLGLFIWHERRESHPLLPMGLFSDRNRVAAYLTLLLVVAGNFGMFFFITQFMQGVLRLSPIQAGLAYLPMAATLLVTVRLVPRLLKTVSAKSLILPGTFMQAVGILWLSRLSPASHYAGSILGPMVLIGLAAGLCFMPLNMTVLPGVAKKESGAASGFAQTMMSVGGSFGLAILVTIYGAIGHGRRREPTPRCSCAESTPRSSWPHVLPRPPSWSRCSSSTARDRRPARRRPRWRVPRRTSRSCAVTSRCGTRETPPKPMKSSTRNGSTTRTPRSGESPMSPPRFERRSPTALTFISGSSNAERGGPRGRALHRPSDAPGEPSYLPCHVACPCGRG